MWLIPVQILSLKTSVLTLSTAGDSVSLCWISIQCKHLRARGPRGVKGSSRLCSRSSNHTEVSRNPAAAREEGKTAENRRDVFWKGGPTVAGGVCEWWSTGRGGVEAFYF